MEPADFIIIISVVGLTWIAIETALRIGLTDDGEEDDNE